jgi:peptide/nickel transport system permease protein
MTDALADLATPLPASRLLRPHRFWERGGPLDIALPAAVLVVIVAGCFAGPALLHIAGPNVNNLAEAFKRPGAAGHILGTDEIGDDVLSRCLFGGRISLEVGTASVALGALVGGAVGVISAFKGGVIELVIMRILDMLLAFPSLVLALVVASYLGPKEQNVIFAIAFFTVPANARIVRSVTLRLKEQDYMAAAVFSGRSDSAIMLRHVAPNAVAPLITFGLIGVAISMLLEATLSYLGLGIPIPQPSWGNMIANGQPYLPLDPALVLVPACFLFVTVLAFNVLGDALRARWVLA